MATSDVFSLHNKGGIDLLDYVGAPVFGLAAVVLTGIGAFSLFGYSFSQPVWAASSATVSLAWVLAVLTLGGAWVTNRAGDTWDDLDDEESAAVGAGAVILVGMAFMPFIRDLVLGSQAVGTVAFIALSGAYTVIAYY